MRWGKKQLQRGGLVLQRKIKCNELPELHLLALPPQCMTSSVEITEL